MIDIKAPLILASFLYFLGWMNIHYYLLSFGQDIFETDIPFYYFFIYSFSVISHIISFFMNFFLQDNFSASHLVLIILAPILAFFVFLARYTEIEVGKIFQFFDKHSRRTTFQYLLLVALFVFGHEFAKDAAYLQADTARRSDHNQVRVTLKPGIIKGTKSEIPKDLEESDPNRVRRVIFATKDITYILVQPNPGGQIAPDEPLDDAVVVLINRADFLVRITKLGG